MPRPTIHFPQQTAHQRTPQTAPTTSILAPEGPVHPIRLTTTGPGSPSVRNLCAATRTRGGPHTPLHDLVRKSS
ncbi:hypothetical protein B0H19DRAFT_1160444 [Mycena capillaripes]|nr:hypothetical protein B0H19DRAFT_1160444 [Mycena capillaripes]